MSQALITPDTVNAVFENLTNCLPVFVSALPSIKKGLLVTFIIIVISIVLAMMLKENSKHKKDIFSQVGWVIVIVMGMYFGAQIGDYVKEKDYTIRCIRLNKQHYSNVHWLKLYMRSFKGID